MPEQRKVEIVSKLLLEYCEKKKTFHIVRDFLSEVRDLGPLSKLVEEVLPRALIKLEKERLIEFEVGHDGISIGKPHPIAYIIYRR